MINSEIYKDEVMGYGVEEDFCEKFIVPKILKPYGKKCGEITCVQCRMLHVIWLQEEYKESETDWSKVAVDTPIQVSNNGKDWYNRYFAKYDNGKVYAWCDGKTSFSVDVPYNYANWTYARLAEVVKE